MSSQRANAQTLTTSNLGAGQVTLNLTSSSSGAGYFTLLTGTGATCGTVTQTVAGEDSTGTSVPHGSLTLTANAVGFYTVRNLSQNASYTACFTPDGSSGPLSSTFTTTAASSFTSPSWQVLGNAGFSVSTANYESLAFAPDGTLYLAYIDGNISNKVTVAKYDGASWMTVGTAGFSPELASYLALAFSPDGTPYVAFQDNSNSGSFNGPVSVMKFNGSAWVYVGAADLSSGGAAYNSLAFAPDGSPYIAFSDGSNNSAATVMRFNGASWVFVGSAGFSAGSAAYTSIAFAPNGTPYIAYQDGGTTIGATVKKFSGGVWTTVGAVGFSSSGSATALYESLVFAPDGTPYVAFGDANNGNKASVMKFDGTSWLHVGDAGISSNSAYYESLAFAPDGTLYLAYADAANSRKVTVQQFHGSAWDTVGSAGFSGGLSLYVSLAISPNGTPYVAYRDGGNSGKASVMDLVGSGPAVTTGIATDVTASSAALNGTVNDNGSATTVTFDYGPTATYGTNISATTGGSISAGAGSTAVSVGLTGLSGNTTYHFRVDATANGNTVNGADATFTTDKQTPAVTAWPTASAIAYGQSLSSSTLSGGVSDVTGTFSWNDSTIVPSSAGIYNYAVTFTPADTNTYATVSNTVSVTVKQATPTLTWSTPADITYGTLLGATQLSAVATGVSGGSLAGAFTYSPAAGSVLSAGSAQTLSVTFTPMDSTNYTTASKTVTINVNVASQTITFAQPATPVTYGVSPTSLSATATSGLTPTFTVVSGPATITGSTLTVTGAGTIVLAANQAGNANHSAATQVTRSIVVNQTTPTLTWSALADITYGKALNATQLNAAATGVNNTALAGTFTYNPPAGTVLNAGSGQTLSVRFTPTDTNNYTTATKAVAINVIAASQAISFTPPASSLPYGSAATVALSATGGSSGKAITFTVLSGPGTISGSTLMVTGAGTIVVAADQAGNSNYSAATRVTQSIIVSKASSTLRGPTTQPIFVSYGQSGSVPVSIAGQHSGNGIIAPSGSISYTIANSSSSTVASGALTISSGSVSVSVTNTFASGSYIVTATYAGDSNYNAAATITTTVQVGQTQPSITWAPASSITYGTTLASILTAQAYSGSITVPGTYSYSINSAPVGSSIALAAGSYSVTVTFTPTDTTTYKSVSATVALTVNKATISGVALTSGVNPVLVQNATVLTANVASPIGTPTGTVTFLDGTTPLGSITVSNGVASLSTSALTAGAHSITATYSGDSNFLNATSGAMSQLVEDFNLSLSTTSGSSQTVRPGGTASYNFNLSPVGGMTLPAAVSLSVMGLPTGATYTVTPESIAPGSGITAVALSIEAPQQTGYLNQMKPSGHALATVALGLLLLPFSGRMRRNANKLTRLAAMVLFLLVGVAGVAALTGCGSKNGSVAQPQKSYTLTVTGTAGALTHSTTMTLTVE